MHDQNQLNTYFSQHWNPYVVPAIHSAYEIIAGKIQPHEWVLDVGCGRNPLKNLLPNVVGIDPAFAEADMQTTLELFETKQRFDVAVCLGAINFGDHAVISAQINKMVSLLQPRCRVYWRLNPGRRDHLNDQCQLIDFYPWTFERLAIQADKHGFVQKNCQYESDAVTLRLYAEWTRS